MRARPPQAPRRSQVVQNQRILVQTRPPRPGGVVNKTQPKAPQPRDTFAMNLDFAVGKDDDDVDDDVYYYIRWRLKLEGETENMGVCTKERKGVTAAVLMATPCTKSLGGESGEHKHGGDVGHRLCWKFAAFSWSGAGGRRC